MSEKNNQYVVKIDPPAEYPITLQEARLQCKVDTDDDDSRITMLIAEATDELDAIEGWLGRALITQTLELVLDRFPCGDDKKIYLPYPKLQSVSSVKYLDSSGTEQTYDPDEYRVVNDATPPYIEPAYGTSWPSTQSVSAAVRVRYVAGYGAAEDVPARIKQYMLHMIAYRYEHPEAASMAEVIKSPYIEHMLENYRVR